MGMRDELRRSGESCGKMESVWGEFGAIGPAFGQKTNDDLEFIFIYSHLSGDSGTNQLSGNYLPCRARQTHHVSDRRS